MSENVDPEPPPKSSQIPELSDVTQGDSKEKVIAFLNKKLENVQMHYHEFLAELAYLQGGGLLTEFEFWRRSRPQDLMHALLSGHLDGDDLKKIGAFMSGQLPIHEMFPVHVDSSQVDNADEDSDDDFDVCAMLTKSFISIFCLLLQFI